MNGLSKSLKNLSVIKGILFNKKKKKKKSENIRTFLWVFFLFFFFDLITSISRSSSKVLANPFRIELPFFLHHPLSSPLSHSSVCLPSYWECSLITCQFDPTPCILFSSAPLGSFFFFASPFFLSRIVDAPSFPNVLLPRVLHFAKYETGQKKKLPNQELWLLF